MIARRLLVVSFAVLLLVPVTVTAGAQEPQVSIDRKLAGQEGNPDLAKVSNHLLRARSLLAAGETSAAVAAQVPVADLKNGLAAVEIRFDSLQPATIAVVEKLGLQSAYAFPKYGVMTGRLDLSQLDELAALPSVAVIHPIYGYETTVGSVDNEADASIRADLARSEFGVDGSGVKVGVISDSFNTTRGGSVTGSGCGRTVSGMTNQTSGDLPPVVGLLDNGSGTDEGAGMAELIHDLAPGADLMFHTSDGGTAAFAAAIDELVDCGADIVVDDIIYLNEPMFQDGFVAQAAQNAVDEGIPYFASAGNYGDEAIAESYLDANGATDDQAGFPTGDDLHDFGGGDRFASLVVPNGKQVRVYLQWNEPFSGSLGPGAAVDLDLFLCSAEDPATCTLDSGNDVQGCSAASRQGDALESVEYTNTTGSDRTVYVAVEHFCGSESVDFRVHPFGSGTGFEPGIFNDYSIFGHFAAAGVVATGAVYYEEIDSGGSYSGGSEINVESFSSLGGNLPIYFDGSGNPLPGAPELRFKPDVSAPDGTNTTFFGSGDRDGDGNPNFTGTSAAAPHAAAVGALMLDASPGLSPAQVRSALTSTAIDIETGGRDPLSGDGLIDARDAVAAANSIDTVAPTWPGGSSVTMSAVTETTATASWTAATDNVAVTEYRVYLDGSFWGSTATTSIGLSGLAVGSTYGVRVEARDAVGNESTGGPSTSFTTADNQAPTWPGSSALTISDIGSTSATASWGAATDDGTVASYHVYLDGASAGSTSSTSYALSGLSPGNTYTVRVEAVDGVGNESTTGPTASFDTTNPLPPGGSFGDDNGNVHEPNIEAIAADGITLGCNPPVNDKYCPNKTVTRGQMAAFLVRALGLTDDGGGNSFTDDDGSVFEIDIAKLAAAGITLGCNPPVNDKYCPNKGVTRGQMAAFLVRALGLTDDGGGNSFVDDDGSVFETDIAKLVAAGITFGCNPPANDQYCPNKSVTRGQMASFLARALGLDPIVPPTEQTFGDGVWLVPGEVPAGTYRNSDSSSFCYWARLSGSPGSWTEIESWLTNQIDIVTISPTDDGFESEDCGTWSTDLSPRTSSPTADFAGGSFLVGSEVSPGVWRNSDSSGGCYWERLSGFGGSIPEIIANKFSTSIQTVTIASTDLGFSSETCGTWTKIG